MEKISGICLGIVLTCALNVHLNGQSISQVPASNALADEKPAFLNSAPTQGCYPTEKLIVPQSVATHAKLKARLVNLLRDSLYDDTKGIVNAAREKEIKNLAHKLTKWKDE